VWGCINHVTERFKLRARSAVITPMRHALTGRQVSRPVWRGLRGGSERRGRGRMETLGREVCADEKAGPSVPAVMCVLGGERSLERLRAGLRYVEGK
jgi:hypothetical protein